MVQRPRGTRDFTPKVMARRLAFEQLLEERARRHGFSRIQTPIFEKLDLFTAKSGPVKAAQVDGSFKRSRTERHISFTLLI